jgi:hypothetical protein
VSATGGASPPAHRALGLPEASVEIVASLAWHRALSTAQIRTVHLPGVRERWCQRVLARIAAAGLIDHVQASGSPQRLWFATEAGVRAAIRAGALARGPRAPEAAEVAGPLEAHTFAVNEAAIRLLVEARGRGDEFGPLAWRHEVSHPLRSGARGRRARAVIADAVLTYLRLTEQTVFVEQRFLEVDRATLPVDAMAAELARYGELFRASGEDGVPLWRSRYPTFPPVLCVLAGAGREALERRRDTALALLGTDPRLTRSSEVAIRICLMEDLLGAGPFAPIFLAPGDAGRAVDWLGEPEKKAGRR